MNKTIQLMLIVFMAVCMVAIPVDTSFAKTVKAKSVSISPATVTIAVDGVITLKAKKKPSNASGSLTWTSSDTEIATVAGGMVQGVAEGTATITVKTSNNKKAECQVTVKDYTTNNEILETFNSKLEDEYYDKGETASLIQETIESKQFVTSSDVTDIIDNVLEDKDYLSKEEAEKYALKSDLDSYLTKEEAAGLATKDELDNYVTKSSIDTMLDSYVTKEDADEFVTKDELSNYVTKEDASAFATKEDLEAFVTAEEVQQMIEQYAPSGGGDWTGTVELSLVEAQELPCTLHSGRFDCTVESVSITKEHFDNFHLEQYYPYKYTIEGSGTLSNAVHATHFIDFTFIPGGAFEEFELELSNGTDFTISKTFYSYYDANEYAITNVWADDGDEGEH